MNELEEVSPVDVVFEHRWEGFCSEEYYYKAYSFKGFLERQAL